MIRVWISSRKIFRGQKTAGYCFRTIVYCLSCSFFCFFIENFRRQRRYRRGQKSFLNEGSLSDRKPGANADKSLHTFRNLFLFYILICKNVTDSLSCFSSHKFKPVHGRHENKLTVYTLRWYM